MSFGTHAVNQYRQVKVESSVQDADPHRLVAMLFDGVQEKIIGAKLCMAGRGSVAEKGALISGAIAILEALRASLDKEHGGEIAQNLDALYDYAQRRLLEANVRNDATALDEVLFLVKGISDAWNAITPAAQGAVAEPPRVMVSVGA